jgi:hypothetical protein
MGRPLKKTGTPSRIILLSSVGVKKLREFSGRKRGRSAREPSVHFEPRRCPPMRDLADACGRIVQHVKIVQGTPSDRMSNWAGAIREDQCSD